MARQAAAERAGFAIPRFSATCQAKRPGKKGSEHDSRSVEYKVHGWNLDPDGLSRMDAGSGGAA